MNYLPLAVAKERLGTSIWVVTQVRSGQVTGCSVSHPTYHRDTTVPQYHRQEPIEKQPTYQSSHPHSVEALGLLTSSASITCAITIETTLTNLLIRTCPGRNFLEKSRSFSVCW
ncbi:hypothetical protein FJTKL_00826 [Diaporthe vaccinii]|uniref:Uncharacterized protein n=1 Tax=Diaporthe vaccinii TaxID=105482 RepID=A0ABR4E254_9PEZI